MRAAQGGRSLLEVPRRRRCERTRRVGPCGAGWWRPAAAARREAADWRQRAAARRRRRAVANRQRGMADDGRRRIGGGGRRSTGGGRPRTIGLQPGGSRPLATLGGGLWIRAPTRALGASRPRRGTAGRRLTRCAAFGGRAVLRLSQRLGPGPPRSAVHVRALATARTRLPACRLRCHLDLKPGHAGSR